MKKDEVMVIFEELLEMTDRELRAAGLEKTFEGQKGSQEELIFKNFEGDTFRILSTKVSSGGKYPEFIDKFFFNGVRSNATTQIAYLWNAQKKNSIQFHPVVHWVFYLPQSFLLLLQIGLTICINSYLYYYSVINIVIYYIYFNNNSNIISLK